MEINFVAVVVAALSSFIIGGIWYSPLLFQSLWMKENNFTEEQLKQGNMTKIFGPSIILTLIMALNLAAFLGKEVTFAWGLSVGALVGFGWVATAYGITYLFERKSFKLWLINVGYHIIAFTTMGGILGAWQ